MILKLPTLVLLSVASSTQGFTFVTNTNTNTNIAVKSASTSSSPFLAQQQYSRSNFVLNAESSEKVEAELTDDEPKKPAADESEESSTDVTAEAEEEEAKEEEEEEEETEEEKELKALKEEITNLENSLKQKNRDLNNIERMSEEYTKGGYARKVAEMESFRRSKSIASTDNKMAARATILQSFLPVLDKLQANNAQYEDDEFAKSYRALCGNYNMALKELGVVEYTVKEGEKADSRRIVAIKEEYSDTMEKGCVISPVAIGFELDGNVMKFAEAVVSLGPEPAEEEATEEEAEEGGEEEASEAEEE
jgi:molecular chaperone GrpE (heat shock protein)